MNTSDQLDPLDIMILDAIERGGWTDIPDNDSDHTASLQARGYIVFERGVLVLTDEGRAARDDARGGKASDRGPSPPF